MFPIFKILETFYQKTIFVQSIHPKVLLYIVRHTRVSNGGNVSSVCTNYVVAVLAAGTLGKGKILCPRDIIAWGSYLALS